MKINLFLLAQEILFDFQLSYFKTKKKEGNNSNRVERIRLRTN